MPLVKERKGQGNKRGKKGPDRKDHYRSDVCITEKCNTEKGSKKKKVASDFLLRV